MVGWRVIPFRVMRNARATAIVACLLLGGCATIMTRNPGRGPGAVSGKTGVYRGALLDLQLLASPLLPLAAVDLPLSLAADTILFPYDLYVLLTTPSKEVKDKAKGRPKGTAKPRSNPHARK